MRQLVELQKQYDEFKALNAELIFVFREEKEGIEGLKKIKTKTATTYTLATDLNKTSTLPYSTRKMTFDNFVVAKDGTVKAVIDGTLRDRATSDQLLEALRKIEGK